MSFFLASISYNITMRKVHIGHGGHLIDGWENYERGEVDIMEHLPWEDSSVDRIMLEHVLEHVPHPHGFCFLREAHRVLVPGGILRVIVPDVVQISRNATEEYIAFIKRTTHRTPVDAIIGCWGHWAAYTDDMLEVFLKEAGFSVCKKCEPMRSEDEHLIGIDQHHKEIGEEFNRIESVIFDAYKGYI